MRHSALFIVLASALPLAAGHAADINYTWIEADYLHTRLDLPKASAPPQAATPATAAAATTPATTTTTTGKSHGTQSLNGLAVRGSAALGENMYVLGSWAHVNAPHTGKGNKSSDAGATTGGQNDVWDRLGIHGGANQWSLGAGFHTPMSLTENSNSDLFADVSYVRGPLRKEHGYKARVGMNFMPADNFTGGFAVAYARMSEPCTWATCPKQMQAQAARTAQTQTQPQQAQSGSQKDKKKKHKGNPSFSTGGAELQLFAQYHFTPNFSLSGQATLGKHEKSFMVGPRLDF